MADKQKTIFVYDDFSSKQPVLMGALYVNVIKGGESYSFEYDKEWLKKQVLSSRWIQNLCRIQEGSIHPGRISLAYSQMHLRTAGAVCL